MRKETSKTRYGTQRPAKACESAGCNAAQTHPADASVAAKRRLLMLVALRLKKVACEHRCGRCTLHL